MQKEENIMRKLICLMLCILLAASMAVPAFATEDGEGCSHSWEVTSTQQPTCTEAGTKVTPALAAAQR